MKRGEVLAVCLLCWSCSVRVVAAIQRLDMFPYGTLSGDHILAEGDDETSRVLSLPKPLYFYGSHFSQLYVATNGIISAQDLPMEKQYVDDGFPTDFPVVAPFLADIDTSGGRGQIYYRVTETPSVLNRVAQEVNRGFPDAKFTPTHAVVATWENVAAYEEQTRTNGPSNKVNTFQAVIGYDETDSYVLFLYPEGGLNFYGTRPKESYNVEIELPARVGFSRGEVTYLIFSRTEGPHYSVTSDEQSVKNLYQVGNTGIPGVWLFHTGNRYSFDNIVPASIGGLLSTLPSQGHGFSLDTTTPEYSEFDDYPDNTFGTDNQDEEDDYPLTGGDPEFQPAPGDHSVSLQPAIPAAPSSPAEDSGRQVSHSSEDVPLISEPRYSSEPAQRQYAPPNPPKGVPEGGAPQTQEQQPQGPLEVVDVYPPHRNEPPLSRGGHVVSVEEEENFDTGVIQYTTENKETCARFQQQCSQNAFCSDYATGFCCHCRPGFYGNGRQCLPDGAPQRVSGKMSGTVTVGSTPVKLNNIDLHAYIVVGDGRAYTAISEVPEPLGWALMPLAPIGELFGWLFALELPNSQAGFKNTGAEFTRHAEVIFYPGNQRLSIIQTGRGLDDHNHLTVDTVVNGNVPFMPPGAEVTIDPFKEIYQYYPSVATSTSVREFSVVSAERGSESFSFQLKQNITYRNCRHDNRAAAPETLQITMERVFVMYVKEERILRYAITNKISPAGVEPTEQELVNPCYAGNHDCDTTAQCIPLEGQAFQCQCATGYRGDGRNCYDVDECAEGLSSCGAHAYCINLPGSHRCQCQSGFEFGYDGRTCVDIDECSSSPCHIHGRCINALGSFQCQCQSGFYGDGFYCSQQEGQTDRPKSQCEQHRDSLQSGVENGGRLSPGAFIPQCDSDGRYRPLQCHGSTGHCWCVDSRGQERGGTRTPPGTAPIDCDKPEHPKTHCEHHRDSVQTTSPEGYPIVGTYVPQCDANGQYIPLQCHGSTGYCWCVENNGQERAGTRTPPGTTPTDCDRPDEPERPKTHCERHRDSVQTTSPEGYPIVGAYVPQCDANGQYRPLQCHGSTGHCWCVDIRGQERAGTRTLPGTQPKDCDRPDEPEHPKTHCEHHRDSVQTTSPEGYPIIGVYVPQCDASGQYSPLQCHGSTGHCWCVDGQGQERAGTRTSPGAPPTDCDKPDEPERPKTHCEHHRDRVQTISPEGYPILGAYVPQCDANGQYKAQQCHSSTGHCWCVDSRGQERAGTRTPPGTPHVDCDRPDEPERPKTYCEHHRDSVQTTSPEGHPIRGVFVPQCDVNGQYKAQQCHSSTGHCWCVDSRGQERAGTRTPPGTPRVDCDRPDEPERPKTHCEHHRDRAQTTSSEGHPIAGAYVPQCDANGQYTPQQCHGSTGHCWCVDGRGEERRGTRTPPGTPRVDCDRPDEPERPKTHCEHQRDRAQTTSSEGHPIAGAYVPQCDANGQYTPRQCHGSTGHCWCVDGRGQERRGTRTPPGTPRVDCDRPDEPERPKTHCEHNRDSVQTTSSEGRPIAGAYVPQCDANGQYTPRQCHGSTGHCWCVDGTGQERRGTRTPPGTPRVDCDRPDEPERPKTHCEHHRDRAQTTSSEGHPIVGAYVPQCDANGQYTPRQCHGSTGHCWCVDGRGQERRGTRTPPGTPRVDCDRPDEPERPKTHCEHHRDRAQTTSSEGHPIVGAYVPQCDANGQYTPRQCHGSTGHCWCVDGRGQERRGTRTPPGTPRVDCDRPDEPERPKTHCEHQRDSVQTTSSEGRPIAGAYVPQCDANGQYTPRQCHGSTGHCWCVDGRGQVRRGTRTPPGTPRVDCDRPDEPERPKTHCEHQRDSVQTTSSEGRPIAGAYVPQCDANGQYTPRQCHGSTGHCWCVDGTGQERRGTRTPPGTPRVDCDRSVPVPPTQRPESVCERWRASLIEHYGGKPEAQQYVPQCEPDGQFSPVQCYGETTYCWCVDQDGREVPGTRSHDVVKPACLPSVAPPTVRPLPRPDVTPLTNTDVTLLYAQGQKIGALPLNGTRLDAARSKTLLTLHGSIVVGIAHDCKENRVYWTDLSARTINRASMAPGAEPEILVNTNLVSPEGLAVDVKRRLMFWVDSNPDMIESANLDGSGRRTLFNTDLVNPRAIIVDSYTGTLFWTDWNREAPKIESSSVDGHNRRVVVSDGIGLPNALTYDSSSGQVCWADAGTKRLECVSPDGSGRRVIHSSLNYPFSMVYYRNHFYYTDWRRDGVIAVSKVSSQFTDEYLPDQRSHLYGIAIATSHCLSGSH
ncbi:nidogen-2 isoform X17 [Micropterus salmoides]|uniref:nidogen-2 isoform X17 n=1 Tax=Micropterus salmoides TaxID=27706 RepID=UPI0018EAFB88|nr:nidogen-2 isoform X17 [Micropterus salmoides]